MTPTLVMAVLTVLTLANALVIGSFLLLETRPAPVEPTGAKAKKNMGKNFDHH